MRVGPFRDIFFSKEGHFVPNFGQRAGFVIFHHHIYRIGRRNKSFNFVSHRTDAVFVLWLAAESVQ